MHNLLCFWLLSAYSIEHRSGELVHLLIPNTFVTGRALKQIESLYHWYQLRILCVRFLYPHATAA